MLSQRTHVTSNLAWINHKLVNGKKKIITILGNAIEDILKNVQAALLQEKL